MLGSRGYRHGRTGDAAVACATTRKLLDTLRNRRSSRRWRLLRARRRGRQATRNGGLGRRLEFVSDRVVIHTLASVTARRGTARSCSGRRGLRTGGSMPIRRAAVVAGPRGGELRADVAAQLTLAQRQLGGCAAGACVARPHGRELRAGVAAEARSLRCTLVARPRQRELTRRITPQVRLQHIQRASGARAGRRCQTERLPEVARGDRRPSASGAAGAGHMAAHASSRPHACCNAGAGGAERGVPAGRGAIIDGMRVSGSSTVYGAAVALGSGNAAGAAATPSSLRSVGLAEASFRPSSSAAAAKRAAAAAGASPTEPPAELLALPPARERASPGIRKSGLNTAPSLLNSRPRPTGNASGTHTAASKPPHHAPPMLLSGDSEAPPPLLKVRVCAPAATPPPPAPPLVAKRLLPGEPGPTGCCCCCAGSKLPPPLPAPTRPSIDCGSSSDCGLSSARAPADALLTAWAGSTTRPRSGSCCGRSDRPGARSSSRCGVGAAAAAPPPPDVAVTKRDGSGVDSISARSAASASTSALGLRGADPHEPSTPPWLRGGSASSASAHTPRGGDGGGAAGGPASEPGGNSSPSSSSAVSAVVRRICCDTCRQSRCSAAAGATWAATWTASCWAAAAAADARTARRTESATRGSASCRRVGVDGGASARGAPSAPAAPSEAGASLLPSEVVRRIGICMLAGVPDALAPTRRSTASPTPRACDSSSSNAPRSESHADVPGASMAPPPPPAERAASAAGEAWLPSLWVEELASANASGWLGCKLGSNESNRVRNWGLKACARLQLPLKGQGLALGAKAGAIAEDGRADGRATRAGATAKDGRAVGRATGAGATAKDGRAVGRATGAGVPRWG
eukprot:364874-Chlamydomonas_euryale.AAC.2